MILLFRVDEHDIVTNAHWEWVPRGSARRETGGTPLCKRSETDTACDPT
jgi:hypothetical protein